MHRSNGARMRCLLECRKQTFDTVSRLHCACICAGVDRLQAEQTWLASFQCFMAAASAAMYSSCCSQVSMPSDWVKGQSLASSAIVLTSSYSSCLLWPALAAAAAICVRAWPPCIVAILPQLMTEASAQLPMRRTATC